MSDAQNGCANTDSDMPTRQLRMETSGPAVPKGVLDSGTQNNDAVISRRVNTLDMLRPQIDAIEQQLVNLIVAVRVGAGHYPDEHYEAQRVFREGFRLLRAGFKPRPLGDRWNF